MADPDAAVPLPGVAAVLGSPGPTRRGWWRWSRAARSLPARRAGPPARGPPGRPLRHGGSGGRRRAGGRPAPRPRPGARRWPRPPGGPAPGRPAVPQVEFKGLTVTLHWRGVPEAEPWARRFVEEERARSGLVAQPGRLALELRPPIDTDKGTVVRRLAAGHRLLACFGDDLGDLAAFAALDELAAAGATVVKVAVVDDESPAEVAAAADLVLEGPEAALAVLRALAAGP